MEMISFRHNVMNVNSIQSFFSIRGGYSNNTRDVYFVRVIGEDSELIPTILQADRNMDREMENGKLVYRRIGCLPVLKSIEDSQFYSKLYMDIDSNGAGTFKKIQSTPELDKVIANAVSLTINEYRNLKDNISDSMIRNFATKLLFWLEQELGDCFKSWSKKACIKVVADNVLKEQEYLFYLFLTYIGCDVMLIQNRSDIDINSRALKYSNPLHSGAFGEAVVPDYTPYVPAPVNSSLADPSMVTVVPAPSAVAVTPSAAVAPSAAVTPSAAVAPSAAVTPSAAVVPATVTPAPSMEAIAQTAVTTAPDAEKSYEELAQLASSVVMISIHDRNGQIIGSGSGIMIGRDGYILTNNHVASGGCFYSVRIEDDESEYVTDRVIKYNNVIDLAIIRIERQLNPIPIYKGKNRLVRGQKVVAIGSPLGLFNSVSDGIISGFRKIDEVDMIQFTAPISHGSSGGAVLNMQGEIVGISTAGIDSGQNINLAIGYENILEFTSGFTG